MALASLLIPCIIPGGVYADYVKDWLQVKKDQPDLPVLTLFYKNLKKDPVRNIKTIADFIGVTANNELCEQIADACSFKKMRTADSELKEYAVTSPENWKEGHRGIYRKVTKDAFADYARGWPLVKEVNKDINIVSWNL